MNFWGVGHLDPFHKELKFFSGQAHWMAALAPESALKEALAYQDIPNMALVGHFFFQITSFFFSKLRVINLISQSGCKDWVKSRTEAFGLTLLSSQ